MVRSASWLKLKSFHFRKCCQQNFICDRLRKSCTTVEKAWWRHRMKFIENFPPEMKSWLRPCLGVFSADFHSGSVARSRKPIEWMLIMQICWENASSTKLSVKSKRVILQLPIVTSSSTRLWLSIQLMWCRLWKGALTAHTLVESNTNGERLWVNFPDMDTNFWAGIQWLEGK